MMNNNSTPLDLRLLSLSNEISSWSRDCRMKVGAVISAGNQILSMGYNAPPPGWPHCNESGGCAIIAGHCIAGDTLISKMQTGSYNTGHRTVRQIYEQWNHPRKRGAMIRMNIRGVTPQGMIVPAQILDVWNMGEKPLFRMSTEIGRSVRVTADHRVLTASGWKELREVVAGQDAVALNGLDLWNDAEWLRQKYEVEGLTQVQIASLLGTSRHLIKERLDKFGIDRRPFRLGGWNIGMVGQESPSYKGRDVLPSSARSRANKAVPGNSCVICGASEETQVHHLDRDPLNDSSDNLVRLCIPCHNLAHTPHAKRERVVFVTVVSIEPEGEEEVFDITTSTGNFVGDGIVLHNCERTIHAETNAIIRLGSLHTVPPGPLTLTCSAGIPCLRCCLLIAARGIGRIVAPAHSYIDRRTLALNPTWGDQLVMLRDRGIEVVLLDRGEE